MKTSLKPGMTLQGRYRILSLIGKGGMGFVYKVLGLRLNKEFALKEMYDHFVDPGDKERVIKQFQNEAETMARLEHFGIPRIVDTFEENERHYLVMEYVDGKTLEQVVMDNPQYMMESQVIEWIEQILDILDYLHNRPDPIIIRDLKPANIMLGNDGKIHIIDFGIAKIFDPKDRTQTAIKGSGSAGFAPPEQYGSGGTDPRSDIYALGVTLYYLLTKVIIADSVDRILQGGDVLPPSHYNPIVSDTVDALIQKMVELKPDDRFQNVAEIRDYMESANLMTAAVQPSTMKPSASNLPKTAVKMQNQEVVEEWKKRQSQVSLTQAPKTAQMPQMSQMPQISQAAPVPPAAGEREYHFVSEAMLKGKSDEKSSQEKKKKSGIPTFLITGMFVGVFIFLLLCISIPYFLKAGTRQAAVNPSPSPSPSPTVTKVVEEHRTVAGKITKLEKSEDTVKIQVKTSDGP
ncbi:MAG: serine/threonine protein kinase [Vulcanimicrobiota bacterium]